MLRKLMSKRVIGALTVIAVLAFAAGAYAWFSGGGASASGSATVDKAPALAVALQPSSRASALYPGEAATDNVFTFKVSNTDGHSVELTTLNPSVDPNSLPSGCEVGNFEATLLSAPNLPVAITSATPQSVQVNLHMIDNGGNQDPCKGATPKVVLSANQ